LAEKDVERSKERLKTVDSLSDTYFPALRHEESEVLLYPDEEIVRHSDGHNMVGNGKGGDFRLIHRLGESVKTMSVWTRGIATSCSSSPTDGSGGKGFL
jgi:hypothetical protein